MSISRYIVIALAAGLAQVAFLDRFRIFGAAPDLFMGPAVIAAVSFNAPAAVCAGLFAGVFKDLFDVAPVAVNSILYPLTALLVCRLNRTLSLESRLSCSLIAGLAVAACNIIAWIILAYSQAAVPQGIFVRIVILDAALTALAVAALFPVFRPAAASRI